MKKLKKYIREEITKLQEKKYDTPPEIIDTLKTKLKMDPLARFVDKFKAVNTIPPSYRVFLLNGEQFDIYYETFSLLVKIGSKEYFVDDLDERNYAIKHINQLLTDPTLKPTNNSLGGEDIEDTSPSPSPPPAGPPPAGPPPPEEPE